MAYPQSSYISVSFTPIHISPVPRVFQVAVRVGWKTPPPPPQWGEESEILLGGTFYRVKLTWGGVILMIQTFFKAKNFCEHWTSIEIKINMTCVSRWGRGGMSKFLADGVGTPPPPPLPPVGKTQHPPSTSPIPISIHIIVGRVGPNTTLKNSLFV